MSDQDRIEQRDDFKYIRMPSGKLFSFYDAVHAADLAETAFSRAISRAFKLASDDSETREYHLEQIEWKIENMEAYLSHIRGYLNAARGVKSQEDRIARLRNVAGRTPGEAEAFLRKADELERKLNAG